MRVLRTDAGRGVRHPLKLRGPLIRQAAVLQRLALGELEAGASTLLTVLLALLTTRVAGNEAFCLERFTQLGVELHQGARDAELNCVGLTHDAATANGGEDVEGLADVGDAERTPGGCALLCGYEVDVNFFLIDGKFAAARAQENARNRGLAT